MSKIRYIPSIELEELRQSAFNGRADKNVLQTKYKVSGSTADRIFNKLGLKHASAYSITIARRYLAGEKAIILAKENKISTTAIYAYLERHNIPRRGMQYCCNLDFFDKIDSEEKAYFLGFIYADGCLHRHTLKLTLADKDRDVLLKLKHSMNSTHPIHVSYVVSAFNPEGGMICGFEVSHKKIRASLMKHGITERKTENCTVPNIAPDLLRHFIRGYFDGDGGICIYNNKKEGTKYSLSVCGTPEFLDTIRKVFKDIAKVNGYLCKRHKESKSRVLQLHYSGRKSSRAILKYMYDNSTVFLDRKYQLYLKVCK